MAKSEISSGMVNSPRGIEPHRGGLPVRVIYMLPVLLLCLIVGGYLFSALEKGFSRDMILVNGAKVAYTAEINESSFELAPYAYRHVQLPEGELNIKIKGTEFQLPRETVKFETPFFSRPFDSQTIVLNPDRLALLVEEATAYTTLDTTSAKGNYSFHHSHILHTFPDIDYPFKDFPEKIKISSSKKRTSRSRLSNFQPASLGQLYSALVEILSPDELIPYLQRYVNIQPKTSESANTLGILSAICKPEQFINVIRQGLGHRPVLVEWHRIYQTFMEQNFPDYDLAGEYEKYLINETAEPYFKYLKGRITDNQTTAEALYLASENQGEPIGYGYHALAYNYLCSGRFKEALDLVQTANLKRPELKSRFQVTLDNSLMALGKYQELLDSVRYTRNQEQGNSTLVAEEIKYLMLLNRKDEAKKIKDDFLNVMSQYESTEDVKIVENSFNAVIAYMNGDNEKYAAFVKDSFHRDGLFYSALQKQDAAEAMNILEKSKSREADKYLLTYCVAKTTGNTEIAQKTLSTGIDLLFQGDADGRKAAKMLIGDLDEIKTHLVNLNILPAQKRILAATLGLSFPAVRYDCYRIAQTLNFDREFPYQLIRRITSDTL